MDKRRLNIRVPEELNIWMKEYAKKKHTTITQLILDFFSDLKKKAESGDVEQF